MPKFLASLCRFFERSLFNIDDFVKSLLRSHPGESRGPKLIEKTGFRLSPE
jgi:hypothetical protein